jgi:asparagine synthase (glutamine-hydrolysing)
MCGITGFLGMRNDELIRKMTRILSHRGPDHEGIFVDKNISLGHRRLSIIDLSALGNQPMTDLTGRAIISYNGEIYNYKEIQKELISRGYRFQSKTDTEVVLNAYIAWDEGCLTRFNGMFAFAIWDKTNQTLFLARDRIGIKPFYYIIKNQVFVFASEIKSILCWKDFRREVNKRGIDYFFTFRYNHLEETVFKNIQKLLPAHYMKIQLSGEGRLICQKVKYWDIQPDSIRFRQRETREELTEILSRSVNYRMVGDVPIGSFLSGGVDSGLIVGIIRKKLRRSINTFTIGFDYPGFIDENSLGRYTAEYYNTNHTECICPPDINSNFVHIIWNSDELNGDPTLVPTYLLSKIACKHVKVVLTGEGSDELFGGYQKTMFMKYAWSLAQYSEQLTRSIPFVVQLLPRSILNKIFRYSSSIGQQGLDRLVRFCAHIKDIGASYLEVASIMNHNEKKLFYGPEMQGRLAEEYIGDTLNKQYFWKKIHNSDDLFNCLLYFDLKTRLPNGLLTKLDTMTMAHSLEARVPFLDHRLVELAFSMPAHMKIRMMRDKHILRKVSADYLPRKITKRKKNHFFVPIHLWLQNELQSLVSKILTNKNIDKSGYLNSRWVLHAYKNYQQGELFYARQLWSVISFMIWHELYIETDKFMSMNTNTMDLESFTANIGSNGSI